MYMDSLHNAILCWYANNGRHSLPWRDRKAPQRAYRVLISEMMLQQTQVKVVQERYFYPFLQKFPTLECLSNATESEVLRAWQGLGYYTRARNLHKLAKLCAQLGIPKEPELLRKLPGIGAYSAGAIACFGYDMPVSFIDANIKRILTRLFALNNPTPKLLGKHAQMILNLKEPFNHNQALLDLGALICTAKEPKCDICPLNPFCSGKDSWDTLTPKKPTKNIKQSLFLAIYIQDSKIALCKSTESLYFGMYNFPQLTQDSTQNTQHIGILKHSYTQFNLSVHLCIAPNPLTQTFELFSRDSLSQIPLSSLTLKVLKFLQTKGIF